MGGTIPSVMLSCFHKCLSVHGVSLGPFGGLSISGLGSLRRGGSYLSSWVPSGGIVIL